MRRLLALAAVLEAVTGMTLMIAPSVVAHLLLDGEDSGAGAEVGRVAGIALVALGLACWPGRDLGGRATQAVLAMLTYNLLVTCYLIFIGIGGRSVGVLLWPASAIHGLLALLLVRERLKAPKTQDLKA